MNTRFVLAAFAAVIALLAVPLAGAGDFNENAEHLGIKGYDPVAYFRDGVPAKGREEFRHAYRGVTYHFANSTHRDAFIASPDQFLPEYGGFCAFGVSRGYKADIDPTAFTLVGGKLYLNYSAQVKADWQQDPTGHIRRADERWPTVRPQAKVVK